MNDVFRKAFELIKNEADSHSVEKGLAMLQSEVDKNPENAKVWFEYAGAYDYLGREDKAVSLYRKILEIGIDALPPEDRPGFYVQYGSTLRNLGKLDEAQDIFQKGIETYPHFSALKLFKALNDYSKGINLEACKAFLESMLKNPPDESVRRYMRSLKWYFDNLV